MLKKFGIAALCGLSAVFVACASKPPYTVTDLSAEAHRLAFSQSKPMGCMLVGEKEGIARAGETSAMEQLRESAKNDLLNKSAYLVEVGSSKRLVVYHAFEKWSCKSSDTGFMSKITGGANTNPEVPCHEGFSVSEVSTLRVGGEIYECKF